MSDARSPRARPTRLQIAGHDAIARALAEREPVQVLLVRGDDDSPATAALLAAASERGVRIWRGGPGDLRRMGRGPDADRALALVGPPPSASLPELLARGGLTWLLSGVAYPSNVGFAVRTAEVSGADGVVVEARFNHEQRARIDHVSMGASRLLPVLFHDPLAALAEAARQRVRCLALEDVGDCAPWDLDLTGPLVCVIGGERSGLGPEVLARCAGTIRIPMAGFVPSYNVQAAMAAIASERLRQLDHS